MKQNKEAVIVITSEALIKPVFDLLIATKKVGEPNYSTFETGMLGYLRRRQTPAFYVPANSDFLQYSDTKFWEGYRPTAPRFNAATELGKLVEYLSEPEVVVTTIKLNKEYNAVIDPRVSYVQVGCQQIEKSVIKKLAAAL